MNLIEAESPPPATTTTSSGAARSRLGPLLLILGLVFALSSGDRAILGVLKTTLSHELGFSQEDYGRLVTSLLLPYAVMLLLTGGLVNRYGARRVLAACLTIVSLAGAAFGCARSFSHLMLAQIALGVAQAGIAPTIAYIIMRAVPAPQHASAYSVVNAIQSSATVLCPTFVAAVTLALGWRYAFLIPALIGLSLAALWWSRSSRLELAAPGGEVARATWRASLGALWRRPVVRYLLLARIVSDPFWFFFTFWQAAFLREHVGLSLATIGQLAWMPPLASVLAVIGVSIGSDRLVARGWPEIKARVQPLLWVTSLAPAALALPLATATAPAIFLCVLLYVMCCVWLSLSTVLLGTLVRGPELAPALGLVSALGCVAGIGYNLAAGRLIDVAGYTWPFWCGACLHPLAALALWRLKAHATPHPSADRR